jgi:hypothetical protein
MGVLTALPIVYFGNVCCCLWVICGGLTAAYVLQQSQATAIQPGDGALVGLLAGLCGAVIYVILSIPITLLVGPIERALIQRAAEAAGPMPPQLAEALERYGRQSQTLAGILIGAFVALILWLFIGAIFSTIGGLLGAAIFRKETPPTTVDVPPPPS